MGMFSNLTTENLEKAEDRVGGAAPKLPSGIYDAVIKIAYVSDSQSSNAQAVNLHMDINGTEVRDRIWVVDGKGNNYYVAKDGSGKHMPLPGFSTINDLCLLTTEKELAEQDTEEKVVKLWNNEERAEKNTRVPCLTDLHGKTVKVALLRQIENKRARTDSGEYKEIADTVTINVVDKFLYEEDGRTVLEIQNGVDDAEFAEAWLTRNDGKDRDKSKKISTPGSSGTGRPGASSGGSAKSKLFGVAARPGQSAPATFRFGQGYGAIEMALAAHKIPVQYVTPSQWKKHFGLSKDKGASRGLATQRFPSHASDFQRVKDDGRAEAALIALYGKEKFI